jgi:hypothetical protein
MVPIARLLKRLLSVPSVKKWYSFLQVFHLTAMDLNDQLAAYFPFPSLKFNSISVFNRWGTAIYGTENVTLRSGDALWDGFFNGKPPMLGNYVVVAEAAFEDGTTHVFRQQVEILQ